MEPLPKCLSSITGVRSDFVRVYRSLPDLQQRLGSRVPVRRFDRKYGKITDLYASQPSRLTDAFSHF
jgi:hypothetical protein